eukprot:746277-Hanusia_phi.AAC.2
MNVVIHDCFGIACADYQSTDIEALCEITSSIRRDSIQIEIETGRDIEGSRSDLGQDNVEPGVEGVVAADHVVGREKLHSSSTPVPMVNLFLGPCASSYGLVASFLSGRKSLSKETSHLVPVALEN